MFRLLPPSVPGTANEFVGRDAYGESIGYYGDADYSAIDPGRWNNSLGTRPVAPVGDLSTATGTLPAAYTPLYNGNIAHTVNSLQPFTGWSGPGEQGQVLAQVYRYDQLNRLKKAQGVEGLTVAANSWEGVTDAVADRYKSTYTYDANGNILTAERHDETGQQYDDFGYHYQTEGGDLLRNRLYELYDEATATTGGDIAHHPDAGNFDNTSTGVNLNNNYKYDELGNLIADKREEIANIEWTVSGKVKHITRTAGSSRPELSFGYGADGQRIYKQVGNPLTGGYKDYYIRDAQGNIMATYRYSNNGIASLQVTERPIYGSKRLGSYTRAMELVGEEIPTIYVNYTQPMNTRLLHYELNDHLGNVTAVVTGRLLPMFGPGVQYQAELLSAQGYEAFGSLLPGRNYSSDAYRFGFNGKENDNEVFGSQGTFQDYGFRMYDTRVGRFVSADPLIVQEGLYPELSPYQFASLNPIQNIDIDGLEGADAKFENGNSIYFIGGHGMNKEDKEIYNESFNGIVMAAGTGILTDFALGRLLSIGAKAYRAYKAEKSMQRVVTAEKVIVKAEQGTVKAKSAFQTAKEGGLNSGLYKQYIARPVEQVQKGIRSLSKRIERHENLVNDAAYRDKYLASEKVKDPTKKLWGEMSETQQANQIGKWKGEVETYMKQKEVLEGVVKEKTK